MTTEPTTPKELVRELIRAFNDRDRNAFRDLLTEDFVMNDGFVEGIEDFVKLDEAFVDAFPDVEHVVEEMIADGNKVAVKMTVKGTHKGEYRGISPTGKSFEFPELVMVRIEDGGIAEWYTIGNILALLDQLGAVDVPPFEFE